MTRKGLYIGRQLLLVILSLQILNLSVGSAAPGDNAYDYSYTYNKTYDPTETAVEWIVELNYGQQPGFSYSTHDDTGKPPVKSFRWKTDLQSPHSEPAFFPAPRRPRIEPSAQPVLSRAPERVVPPPKAPLA
jgi:hypothetical protein